MSHFMCLWLFIRYQMQCWSWECLSLAKQLVAAVWRKLTYDNYNDSDDDDDDNENDVNG